MSVRNPKLLLKKSWLWESKVNDLLHSFELKPSINIPCGKSPLGDVRVDIDASVNPTQVSDILAYPIPRQFKTVFSDPPWKLNYYKRFKWFFKCVDLCEVGGRIVYNALWIPESKCVKLDETIVRQSAPFSNTSIISIFTKIKDKP